MVIHWKRQSRPIHRIVTAERHEALADAYRDRHGKSAGAKWVGPADHELVDIRVGMAPIVEAFTPRAQGQHSVRNGPAFEIEHGMNGDLPIEYGPVDHHDRLGQHDLGLCPPAGHRVGTNCGHGDPPAESNRGRLGLGREAGRDQNANQA
jgi:hypothetical protein